MATFQEFPIDGYSYSADEVGKALAGMISRTNSGAIRTGMLGSGPLITAVPSSWSVSIGPFVAVRSVGGAARFSGVNDAEIVDIEPATEIPNGQARIDRITWTPSTSTLSVRTGTVATNPVAPSVPSTDFSVATVRVNSGDGTVIDSQVTEAFKLSALSTADNNISAAGTFIRTGNVVAGTFFDLEIEFPEGRFSVAPVVIATASSVRLNVAAQLGLTKDRATLRVYNISQGTAPGPHAIRWLAVQMQTDEASG